ncbi:MAG: hypothetical protein ABI741_14205 [Ferruginibacter sp.]
MSLTYLTYKEIDKDKWDDCIKNAVNGLIYAESAYLDAMSVNWDAIVLDDYAAVMPITWKKKLGIRYIYQPPFMQQGGIFYKDKLPVKTMRSFMDEASARFKFAEFTVNYLNLIDWKQAGLKETMRNNFVLKLGSGYKSIFEGYNTYIKQRLNRLKKFSLQYKHSTDHSGAIALYKELYGSRMLSLTDKDYQQFGKLCRAYLKKDRIIIRHVYNMDGEELLASVLLLKDDKRIYNIISCILPNGKKLLANYFLYNELIREFSGEDIILDFEGSDIPGVSYFYNKFSGNNQQYAFIKFNRLPLPIKLLKR